MFEILETLAPEKEERLPDKRVDKIKASVLSRIEEDKPMKKHFTIKPLLMAAAITATSAISALSAGAATTPAVSEEKLPAVAVASQPAAADTPAADAQPAAPENDLKPDTKFERAESPDDRTEPAPPESLDNDEKGTVSALIVQPTGMELDYGVSSQKISDMEFIGEDDNGVRHYKSSTGGTVSLRTINADEESVVCCYYFEF